jgi:hypothetical protein
VILRAYGALKGAQRGYLKQPGVEALDQADDLFMRNRDELKSLSRLVQEGQEQNILNVFNNKTAPALMALERKLSEAGSPELFEELRRKFLQKAFDDSASAEAFGHALARLGEGVRGRYFSDDLTRELMDLAQLRDGIKGTVDRAFRAGRGEGREVRARFLRGLWDAVDDDALETYRSGQAAKIAAEIIDGKRKPPGPVFRGVKKSVGAVGRGTGHAAAAGSRAALLEQGFEIDERGFPVITITNPRIED